jgi:hypothetical protein
MSWTAPTTSADMLPWCQSGYRFCRSIRMYPIPFTHTMRLLKLTFWGTSVSAIVSPTASLRQARWCVYGCFESYMDVWNKFRTCDDPSEFCLVLEDDVVVSNRHDLELGVSYLYGLVGIYLCSGRILSWYTYSFFLFFFGSKILKVYVSRSALCGVMVTKFLAYRLRKSHYQSTSLLVRMSDRTRPGNNLST